jgi:predicted O-linked N-acetylglucosamine transferase (SPINDLY family)
MIDLDTALAPRAPAAPAVAATPAPPPAMPPGLPTPMPLPGSDAWLAHEAAWVAWLDDRPDDLVGLRTLARLRLVRGDGPGSQLLLARLCALAPNEAEPWHALGFALSLTGDFTAALLGFEQALTAAPDRFDIARHYIDCAQAANQVPDTLAKVAERVAAAPSDVIALYMQAGLLMHAGQYEPAIDIAEVVTLLAPERIEGLRLLGQLLVRSLDVNKALEVLRRAIAMAPDDWELGNDHAVACLRAYQFGEACDRLEDLNNRFGPRITLLGNLSNARLALGDQAAAEAAARAAIALDPDDLSGARALLNVMAYRPGVTAAEMLAQARACTRFYPPEGAVPFANTADPDRRLRIGLLSGTLKVHPVGWLTLAGLEALDPRQFELIAYAQHTSSDWISQRFQAIAAWRPITAVSDAALAALMREDQVDMLIDLGGYGDHGRMAACAQRLAPVQIKWVGSQAYSTGLATMDWFISDRWETPPHLAPHYCERLMILPDGYVCYTPPPDAPDVGPLPARAAGHVMFGCFNNLAKVNRTLVAAWAEILRRVPTARLLLRTHQFDDPATADRLSGNFLRAGIDLSRVELKGSASHRALLGEYNRVDIVLDPFPYNGGLTTCEALYMGVPVLTLPGETFAGRHAYSHVCNIGLDADWVARDLDDYIARAVAHAGDIATLEQVRAGLRGRMRASPLCDGRRFGVGLGQALRRAWLEWCERGGGGPPAPPPRGPLEP